MMRDVLVAEKAVELDDGLVLLLREVAALEVRPEVVDPPQAAALAAAGQAGGLGQGAPAPLSVRLDVGNETVVLFLGPGALVGVRLLAARRPPHGADGAFLDSCWCAPSRWWVAQQSRAEAGQWRLLLRIASERWVKRRTDFIRTSLDSRGAELVGKRLGLPLLGFNRQLTNRSSTTANANLSVMETD
jgi:hypothetical protein